MKYLVIPLCKKSDGNQVSSNQEPTTAADFNEGKQIDLDDLDTPLGSEDEGDEHRYPKIKMFDSGEEMRFELRMTFATKNLVKDAVLSYAMESKKNWHFDKKDSKRIVAKCEKECPFYMRFSKRVGNQFWQLISLKEDHTCHRTAKNRQVKTELLAKKFMHILRHTPEMIPKGLIAQAFEKWGVKLSFAQAYMAKTRSLELTQGALTEQYSHLRNYAEEIRQSNPSSTFIIKCGMSNIGPVFERIYVCVRACKAAFANTRRPLIRLDACFLKGEYGG
ncbi:uncharacterized protein LOC131605728 [Vicia villosa]|uniref:uncharacterized protein LOC131605728 n=1 Tax=Vicia villosa TaxID=3911 RepID=UPI00273AC518|nr:uncharacterized protein LOC131605728 [Vicia villosa]